MDKWTNFYVIFIIGIIVEFIACIAYYSFHMISALFFIGLCFYVSAMRTDLKLRLQEVQSDVDNIGKMVDNEFERKIFNEIKFHGRLYE